MRINVNRLADNRTLRRCLFLLCLLVAASPCYCLSIVAGPYLQNPSRTSMTVMWITDQNCTSWVEYGTDGSLDQKAFHSRHGLIDADQTIHRVTIDGLSPGRSYMYRVCSKEVLKFEPYKVAYGQTLVGDTHTFKALAEAHEAVSFIVLNDTHEKDDLLTSLIGMAESKPRDLIFLNGDILNHLEDEPQIVEHLLKPCCDLFAKETPFVYVRGNHETRGRFARMLGDYLTTPGGRYYYSFDHGPVHFIVMDTGEDKDDSRFENSGLLDFFDYRQGQKLWLEKEIRTKAFKQAAFRVVIMHIPSRPSNTYRGQTDIFEKWTPLFNRGRIDLLISGHAHKYSVVEPEKGVRDYPMIIGGGPTKGAATVIRVDATKKKLELTMTTGSGKKVHTYELDKRPWWKLF